MAARWLPLPLLLALLLPLPAASAQVVPTVQEAVDEAVDTIADAEEGLVGTVICLVQDPLCPATPVGSPVACLLQPTIPEEQLYYIVWFCATRGAVPEPVYPLTGCRFVFGGPVDCEEHPLVGCALDPPGLVQCGEEHVDFLARALRDAIDDLREKALCLFEPVFPETPPYYVVWYCATGGAVPEPIYALTGCTVDTQGLVHCLQALVAGFDCAAGEIVGQDPAGAAACLTPPYTARLGPVECLLGPHIPETFVYYIAWHCLTGGAYGEPVRDTTGCTVGFGLRLECAGASPAWRVERAVACLAEPDTGDLACALGVQPDPVACLVASLRDGTPCR